MFRTHEDVNVGFARARRKRPPGCPRRRKSVMLAPPSRGHGEPRMPRFALPLCIALATAAAQAQTRLPTIPPAAYTPEQKQAAADFEAARKVPVFGPFEP